MLIFRALSCVKFSNFLNVCLKAMQSFLKSGKLGGPSGEKSAPSTSKTSKKPRSVPWVEKYRPKTVQDVVEQSEAVAVLGQCIAGADLPNLLFYGPPGTGKTSTVLAAARQLFGDMYRQRILELNASDERGIQVVRDKVKSFAQQTASGVRPDGKPCPPFKIIILDEADSMTHAAQAALRRTMEKETKTTRFCLICNYVSRIIEPLTSRCTKFQFKPLHENKIFERLQFICNEENVKCGDDVLKALVSTSGGDMRRAITCLQSCSRLTETENVIKVEDVYEVTGVVPDRWISEYLSVCKTKNYTKIEEFLENFTLEAYSASQILDQVNEMVINSDELNNKQKALIGDKLGKQCKFLPYLLKILRPLTLSAIRSCFNQNSDLTKAVVAGLQIVGYRLQDGGSEYLQLLDLGCAIMQAYSSK